MRGGGGLSSGRMTIIRERIPLWGFTYPYETERRRKKNAGGMSKKNRSVDKSVRDKLPPRKRKLILPGAPSNRQQQKGWHRQRLESGRYSKGGTIKNETIQGNRGRDASTGGARGQDDIRREHYCRKRKGQEYLRKNLKSVRGDCCHESLS